jgi:hypothetical protein
MLDTGQHPRLGFEPIRESRLEGFEEFSSRMKKATEEAKAALTKAADDMARFYDIHHGENPPLEVRDKVKSGLMHRTSPQIIQKRNSTTNGSDLTQL